MTKFNQLPQNDDVIDFTLKQDAPTPLVYGRPIGKIQNAVLNDQELMQSHRYVLYNCDVCSSFISEHRNVIKRQLRSKNRRSGASPLEIERIHHFTFIEWFASHVNRLVESQSARVTDHIKWLAQSPNKVVRRFTRYIINGVRNRTKDSDMNMRTQNSGVMVSSNTSCSDNAVDYYGVVTDIIELNYFERFRVVLFKCDWVDVERGKGVKNDPLGFTLVNLSKLVYIGEQPRDEPFIFASQVKQVFYVQYAFQPEWHVVVRTTPRDVYELGDELSFDYTEGLHGIDDMIMGDNTEVKWVRNDVDGLIIDKEEQITLDLEAEEDEIYA